MTFNSCTFHGRLGRDPETRYFETGTQVANFTIAVDRMKTRDQQEPEPLWIRCVVWGKRAEVISNYFKKGSEIIVTGKIDLESFTPAATGVERQALALRVEDFGFCGPKPDDRQVQPAGPPKATAPWNRSGSPSDEDVPF